MVFEDGTHYEGEFKSAGCFNGKGTLTLNTGDRLEGNLQGMWNDGIKFSGTLFKSSCLPNSTFPLCEKLDSKPRYCIHSLHVLLAQHMSIPSDHLSNNFDQSFHPRFTVLLENFVSPHTKNGRLFSDNV